MKGGPGRGDHGETDGQHQARDLESKQVMELVTGKSQPSERRGVFGFVFAFLQLHISNFFKENLIVN